jgi:hypothetical protein
MNGDDFADREGKIEKVISPSYYLLYEPERSGRGGDCSEDGSFMRGGCLTDTSASGDASRESKRVKRENLDQTKLRGPADHPFGLDREGCQ